MRVLLLHERALNPLRIPLFNAIAGCLEKENIRFKVLWLRNELANKCWTVDRSSIRHEYQILGGSAFVLPYLVAERPDVVIGSYGFIGGWQGLLYSKLLRSKFILWSGSWMLTTQNRGNMVESLKRLFVRGCNSYVSYGSLAGEYLKYLGASEKKIFVGHNMSDLEFYDKAVGLIRLRDDFQQTQNKYAKVLFLFAGQLVTRKGIINLLHSFSQIPKRYDWQLLVAGDGPLRSEIGSLCQQLGIADRVTMLGFLDRAALAEYFALADLFVLPSLIEPFSLVLSEALVSGLYVIASKYDGAAYDLVNEPQNGIVIDPMKIDEVAKALTQLMDRFDSLPSREEVRQSIAHMNADSYAAVICRAINAALTC